MSERQPERHPIELLHFIKFVNEGDYYMAHEVLESYWHSERIDYYKGLIQVAVGSYHLRSGNIAGARALFSRAHELLRPYRPEFRALNVERVLGYLEDALARIPQVIELERDEVAALNIAPITLQLEDGTELPTTTWVPEEEEEGEDEWAK